MRKCLMRCYISFRKSAENEHYRRLYGIFTDFISSRVWLYYVFSGCCGASAVYSSSDYS